jgi:hypothetical protein
VQSLEGPIEFFPSIQANLLSTQLPPSRGKVIGGSSALDAGIFYASSKEDAGIEPGIMN